MTARTRPKPGAGVPKETMRAEGLALSALWKSRANRTQDEFASDQGFSQGNFSHYVGGRRPIPLGVALAIAKELGCELQDFSSRLAKELEDQRREATKIWPFASIPLERVTGLSAGKLMQVEGALLEVLERLSPPAPPVPAEPVMPKKKARQ